MAAGRAEHPRADGHDEPGVLGHADELDRRPEDPRLLLPPQQCLEAFYFAGLHIDDGLVEQPEFVALERPIQRVGDAELLGARGTAALVEHFDARPSGLFGEVHGGVGVAQQVIRSLRRMDALRKWPGHRYPDAHRHVGVDAADRHRLAQALFEALGDLECDRCVGDVVEQQRELVTAEARDEISFARHPQQTLGDDA